MANILDASALISLLPTLLPSADKKLRQPQDALAALSHSIFSALAFRLIAVDESSSTSPDPTNTLPPEWKENGPGNYTFRYKHEQSSLEFIVKISKLGSRTLFNAIAVENDKTTSLDISTEDFTSPSSFPYDVGTSETPLVHCFISSNRVTDFVAQYKLKIIQKLVPGLRKDGYIEEADEKTHVSSVDTSRSSTSVQPPPQIPRFDPNEEFPYHPSHIGPRNPLQIGRRDLDPIPGGSFQPPPLFAPDNGDGMYVGPDHPIFSGRRGQGMPGIRGPWGGDGFLPPMGAPPGARFDPVGPVFPGNFGPRRGGNVPGGGNLHGPDNDEFMPPGAGDMFM